MMNITRDTIDLSVIDHSEKPVFAGIEFDSRPAAMRHLLVAKKVVDRHVGKDNTVGLDIGSKYGMLRRILSEYGIDALRLDVVQREDADGLVIGNGKSLPFPDNSLDFVVVSHVLAHIDDLPPFMAEIRRALKVGGDLIVLQNNRYGWWKYWGYYIKRNDRALHYRTFSSWDIRELLRRSRLQIQEMRSPYYFYLHSKWSDFCFKFDRRHGHRIPSWLATQWLIVASKTEGQVEQDGPIKIPVFARPLVESIALAHSLFMKALELTLRVVGR
jgi:SAM-dependent methyltransferase